MEFETNKKYEAGSACDSEDFHEYVRIYIENHKGHEDSGYFELSQEEQAEIEEIESWAD